jgi:hypothetical protein
MPPGMHLNLLPTLPAIVSGLLNSCAVRTGAGGAIADRAVSGVRVEGCTKDSLRFAQ